MNPFVLLVIGVLVAAVAALETWRLWTRSRTSPKMQHDFLECPVCSRGDRCAEGNSAELGLTEDEHEMVKPHYKPSDGSLPLKSAWIPDVTRSDPDREPMRNRFLPYDEDDLDRSARMAVQIIGDQQAAHETPGPQTHAPAPGEPGYRAPRERIDVTVGPYTVHLDRLLPAEVTDASHPGGGDFNREVVPDDWEGVVATLAMEVLRLREGWEWDDGK